MSVLDLAAETLRPRFEPPFSIFGGAVECRAVPGKGVAAFALRRFAAGEVIGREKPLLWVPFHWPFNKQQSAEVGRRVAALSEADRELFFASANVYLDPDTGRPSDALTKAAGIFHTNSFDMPGATPGASCGIYPQFARLNHSCNPNARQQFDAANQTMVLYAERAIAAGEELHDSYTDLEAGVAVRREQLLKYYHFLCDCPRCAKEQAKLDARQVAGSTARVSAQAPQQRTVSAHAKSSAPSNQSVDALLLKPQVNGRATFDESNATVADDAVQSLVEGNVKCTSTVLGTKRPASLEPASSGGNSKPLKPVKPTGWAKMNKAQRLAWHKAQSKQSQATVHTQDPGTKSAAASGNGQSDDARKLLEYEVLNRHARHIPPVSKLPEEGSVHLPTLAEREELVFAYDTKKYDFRSIIVDMFKQYNSEEELALEDADESDKDDDGSAAEKLKHLTGTIDGDVFGTMLSNLHRTRMAVSRCARVGGASGGRHGGAAELKGQFTRTVGESGTQPAAIMQLKMRFHDTLLAFVRDVVAPLVGAAPSDVGFQRAPTFRLSFPSVDPMGHPHCDAEYHHQPGELNVWLPLTAVWGSNTLFTESRPGQGDFHPIELGYGRGVRFWGNRCQHYCVANASGATRVSIDFRVVATQRHDTEFVDGRGKPGAFKLGEYYRLSSEVPARPVNSLLEGGDERQASKE
jgi:hypothetical protein